MRYRGIFSFLFFLGNYNYHRILYGKVLKLEYRAYSSFKESYSKVILYCTVP